MRLTSLPGTLTGCVGLLLSLSIAHAEITVEKTDGGVTIKADGKPFTRYVEKSGTKPILWPVIGPTGQEMTRSYPMAKKEGEKEDHVHHRSFWLTHGDVNKVSFWAETGDYPRGTIEHASYEKTESGPIGVLVTTNKWKGPDGGVILEGKETYRFGADGKQRWIELDATLTPAVEEVTFGDTKEGSFGIRVDETMKVEAKQGGQIVNSNGEEDDKAWGKRARWVDYHGPVEAGGETLGIAILNHPTSFRHPTYWHVRTYGLFAANPFGIHDFTAGKEPEGKHTIKKGETLRLRHLVILHSGDEKEGKIAEAWEKYGKEK